MNEKEKHNFLKKWLQRTDEVATALLDETKII